MQLGYTIIYVDNVSEALAFYQKAFGFAVRFVTDKNDWGELDTGATTLAFASHALMAHNGKNTANADPTCPCFEIALITDDVPAALARALEAGATLASPAQQSAWGQTIAYVTDPYGVLIEICTPVNV